VGSVLVIRLGYRTVAVIGSVLAIVGFISASFAPNFELLTLTYGAIAGKDNKQRKRSSIFVLNNLYF